MLRFLSIILYTFLLSFPSSFAHELRAGYVEITELSHHQYEVKWKNPIIQSNPLPVALELPESCETPSPPSISTSSIALVTVSIAHCELNLAGQSLTFSGLESTISDILVRYKPEQGSVQVYRATPQSPQIQFSEKVTTLDTARTYFILGIEHILAGLDHLLFVLALLLIITDFRRLAITITAFTLSHSITLITSTLGFFSLPAAPVEAIIALSIVFLASELAKKTNNTPSLTAEKPWLVAFAFGLLHGFGFAGALSEIGLPQGDIPIALLTFNLGVEAGQLLFIIVAMAIAKLISNIISMSRLTHYASYFIGITASVWLIERIV